MKPGPLSPERRRQAYDALVAGLATRKPPVRIVPKASVLHQRLADRALRVLSLGRQDRYLTEYVTTLGHTIYVPSGWDQREPGARLTVLRHELVHVAQFERYGALVMTLFYGLLPWPIGLAYFRARLELEAYRETLVAVAEVDGLEAAASRALRDFVVERFVGPDYLYMWPFRRTVERWVEREQAALARRFDAA